MAHSEGPLDPPFSETQGNCYLLLAGLEPPSAPVTLAPGLTVSPVTIPMEEALEAVDFEGDPPLTLYQIAENCRCEIESAIDDASAGTDAESRAVLASDLLTLMNFTRQLPVAVSRLPWNTIEKDTLQRLKKFGLSSFDRVPRTGKALNWDNPRCLNSNPSQGPITSVDVANFRDLYAGFSTLAASDVAFQFALQAAVDWRFAFDQRAAVARLWSGIDAIIDVSADTSFQIAAYSACILHPRGASRRQSFREIRKLYKSRSNVVHGHAMDDEMVQRALDDSFTLLRKLLLEVGRRGVVPTPEDREKALFDEDP